jgi:hypothetical protein
MACVQLMTLNLQKKETRLMNRKNIPFDFVFDYLVPLDLVVKPMFGLWAIYVNEKIMLILRQRKNNPATNGVWIATSPEHHKSLRTDLSSLCSIPAYSKGIMETEWQFLPVHAAGFEASVRKVCALIRHGDQRIGRIPKPGKIKAGTRSETNMISKKAGP